MAIRSILRDRLYTDMREQSFSATSYWLDEEPNFDLDKLTNDDMARGWQRLLKLEKAGEYRHCMTYDHSVREAERAITDPAYEGQEDYDACVIDAVIQLAMFDDIVYS